MILKDPVPRTREEMQWAIDTGYVIPAFKNAENITVELLLDYVDLRLDWYLPSIDSLRFVNFIRLCLGREPENKNPKSHYFFIDCIFKSPEVKPYFQVRNMDFESLKGNTLILSTREFSKSTLICYLLLYMADTGHMPRFGKVNFGMYVSDRMDGNVKTTMQTIESLYLESEYLQSRFEWVHFTDAACEFIRKPRTKKEIQIYNKHMAKAGAKIEGVPGRMERKFKVQGLGSSGGRGSRDSLSRPQFAIFDDMVANEKDAFSKAILESIDSTIEADVGSSLSGQGHFKILIGTAYHTGDPVYKRVTYGEYLPVVFPKAEVQPHGDIYDKDGNLVKPKLKKEDFVSVWEDRHPYEKQRKIYAAAEAAAKRGNKKALKTVDQEYYVRVTSEFERLIGTADIRWKDVRHIYKNAELYHWYITTDYTTTANAGSDNSCQILWAVDWEENQYLMDIKLYKMEIDEQYENTLELWNRAIKLGALWCDIGIEIDGQQSLHLINFQRYCEKYKKNVSFAKQLAPEGKKVTWEGIRSRSSGGNKLERLRVEAVKYHRGKVFYNKELKENNISMEELLQELKMATMLEIKGKDDGLDGLSQMSMIDIDYPIKPIEDEIVYNNRDLKVDPYRLSLQYTDYDPYEENNGYF